MDGAGPAESLLQADFLKFRQSLAKGDIEGAMIESVSILERSRSKEERDPIIEALIRMERALHGTADSTFVGTELRWCADRLNAVSSGSVNHGVCLLNLAAWHRNRGETMMSLSTHSDISLSRGHPNEVVGLSRLEVSRIMANLGDLDPAMRHLWSARQCLSDSGMIPESLSASLVWLNLALEEVDSESPTMSTRIAEAAPRNDPGRSWVASNPDDVRSVVESLMPVLLSDVSGEDRRDIGLLLDAAEVLGEESWLNEVSRLSAEIQDPRVLDALQS